MSISDRLDEAARRFLRGDDSRDAADRLEAVVIDDYQNDERLEELIYARAMYSPGEGVPYFSAEEVREALERALAALDDSTSSDLSSDS